MDDGKKQQILQTAMEVFQEKGYTAASMQEIAEACGMAKGSIYKYFPSKEDLFTAVFVACHQTMFDQAREMDLAARTEALLPKERLRRKIEFQLQYMLENYFFMFEFKELPIKENEKFILAWKKKRATLLTWHKDCMVEAYGERVEGHVWDVVAIYRGILREYLTYAVQKVIVLPMSELAQFIVERIDAIVGDMLASSVKPILRETNVYFNDLNPIDPLSQQQNVRDFLQSFAAKIQELTAPEPVRRELLEVVSLLQKELEQKAPNPTLVQVFITYLETIPQLRPLIRQLSLLI
ncbi:TetR/AcrR family transcriptional regulator [Brevibacillus choshinensis]|uniref:TetR/AcrR family transcriptional regulator n=1 Tax=Brevibacillus choshinensis TaxID=54911 RepID=A0ABX7FQY8_BRECH|nr:TetR/AcrR family transcriptional regulator [Brevibacillus choshinensis]QRG68659.1 TetR/AcrR family transcriptional regulator [Brevibacillus choshinensis]